MRAKALPLPCVPRLEALLLATLLTITLASCSGGNVPVTDPAAPAIPLEPCHLSSPGSSARLSARCGTLAVYEDRAAQSGRQINLRIAVIPARGRNPAPDPLFFITGGPGEAATQDYVLMHGAFQQINEERDIVLVDQRGTGDSHPLDCPMLEEDILSTPDEAALRQNVTRCLDHIDADPNLYTTSIAMDDLDQVRAALGYDKINVYGISYGTRAALTFLRQHERHVRTVILDGVLPQDEPLGISVASDAQRALDLILERCAADGACAQAFPNLEQRFDTLLSYLMQQPVTTTVSHPTTAEPTEVIFSRDEFASTVRLLTYSPETAALLPLLFQTTGTSDDFSRLAAHHLLVSQQLQGGISEGMSYSVVCAEDVPFLYEAGQFVGDAAAERRSYLGEVYQELETICDLWPVDPVAADFKTPVTSDVPVLLLSGEADPVTPPSNGNRVTETLSNSLHLVAPGQGHGVISRGCIPDIATAFIDQGTVEGLDTTCVNDIQPMPFFVNFAGPIPEVKP